MATLEKIRSKAGLLVLVVGLALFAFIIGDFLNSGSTYFRQSQERIAEIDGDHVLGTGKATLLQIPSGRTAPRLTG